MQRPEHIEPVGLDSEDLKDEERKRIYEFIERFREATGSAHDPQFIIVAPGRINLIGDHVDYHKYPVAPMAIERSILLGVSLNPNVAVPEFAYSQGGQHASSSSKQPPTGSLFIVNREFNLYPTFQGKHSFSYGSKLDTSHQWHHYVLCGYHGILATQLLGLKADQIYEHAKSLHVGDGGCGQNTTQAIDKLDTEHLSNLANMILFVDSDIPPASGLSSSSALVCASALATRLALGHRVIHRESLAEDCARFEHLVGTHGGGMDQAVILTAERGFAKIVDFMPSFVCDNIYLHKDAVWLVSHCGESCAKAATSGFNSRVLETKLAAALMHKTLKIGPHVPIDYTLTIRKIQSQFDGLSAQISLGSFRDMIKTLVFRSQSEFTIDELASKLDMTRAELIRRFKTSEEFLERSGMSNRKLPLLKRCLHVIDEAERVEKFHVCNYDGDIKRLGKLMTESHTSLRDQYECSHPALDKLVDVSLKAGALGARLTGAGWGGCIVSLVEPDKSNRVMAELEKISRFTFRTEPQSGARIIRVGSSGSEEK